MRTIRLRHRLNNVQYWHGLDDRDYERFGGIDADGFYERAPT